MSDLAKPLEGIALLCRRDGSVIRILRNDLRAPENLDNLSSLVDSASRDKVEHFLAILRDERAAFGWEMNVPIRGVVSPVHFAGTATGEGLFIIAAMSRSGVMKLSEELMRINNDQTTALRSALKELSLRHREQSERDTQHFDEVSRVNNELVTLQRELAQRNHQLARLNQLKNQFLGMASHDLRKPIHVILANADVISRDELNEHQRVSLDLVRQSAHEMLRALEDFVDIAQIESGALKLHLAPLRLDDLLRQRITRMQPLAAAKQMRIEVDAASIPEARLDARRIAQVVDNLIENAIKYGPPASVVKVALTREQNRIVLSVLDEGRGIAPEEAARLFQPFQTTGTSPTGGEKSTGLGLAIARAIARKHGGDVSLESSSRGARFVLSLPL